MKKYILIVVLFVLYGNSLAQTKIYGTILSYDGKPMQMAHVSIYKANQINSRVFTEVAKDGSYSLSINEKGPFFINVVGLNHQGESVFLASDDFLNEKIDFTLELKQMVKSSIPNKIIGDFNGFNQAKAVDMKKMPDSSYSALIETKQDKIKFVIIVGTLSSSNGTQPAEYEFDSKKGFYLTVLKSVNGKVEISFDPAKLPVSDSKATIKFEKESTVSRIANIYWAYNSITKEFMNAFMNSMLNNKKNTYDLVAEINKFDELYNKEENKLIKQIIVLLQANLGSLSTSKEDFKEKIANKLIEEIKLDSYLLNLTPSMWIGTVFEPRKKDIANELARRSFVDNYIETASISKEEKAKLILSLLQGAKAAYNEPLRKKYYALITDKYADTETSKKAKEYSDEFQLVAGSPIPKFSIVSHDDKKTLYTNETFKGKIYMIDFWATWCGPCKAEMPELHKVYEKYKDKGFEILSISFDQKEDAIDKYRKGEWKMPWQHSFVDGEIKAKIAKDFDAAAIPKPFLVDGNTGKILALTTDLRGENLEKTIQKFVK